MSIVTANLLGVGQFGVLGILTGFVSDINRLLSFRMSEVVVRYVGEALEQERQATARRRVVKAAALVEGAPPRWRLWRAGLAGALWRALSAKDAALAPLCICSTASRSWRNLVTETATGVLQVTGHFRTQALINLVQSVLVAAVVVGIALERRWAA